jgi:cytoplasmic iron level regulating protein YaaA (DUF328/UPF0246 family)
MPTRQLTPQDNFGTISTWLDKNLTGPFPANLQHLPPEDNSRGIYFWFMKPEGYQKMSELGLNITAVTPVYPKVINGNTYHLVYLGTAGTHRGQTNTLFLRLSWHISDNHNQSSICHKSLSTLRQTVGATLSDDLIFPNTENLVNEFLDQFFYICSLSYPRDIYNATNINNDEKKLIIELKPLLNIKENPNALNNAPTNPTKLIDTRRKSILLSTQNRLGCIKNGNNLKKSKKGKDEILPDSNHIKLFQPNNCVEFYVKKDESIHDIIQNIKGIPNLECTIELFEKNKPQKKIYEKRSGTRRTNIIYKYFGNTDNNQPRWKVIQQEMLDKGIEEITVRVCSEKVDEEKVVENSTKKKRGRPKTYKPEHTWSPGLSKNEIIERLTNRKKDSPVLLILGCSNSKSAGGDGLQSNYFESECINNQRQQTLDNYNESIENNPENFNLLRNGIPVNANDFANCQNEYKEALDRYCTNRSIFFRPPQVELYRQKIAEGKLHILILSGLYGVLKWNDKIIDYHLEFKPNESLYTNDLCVLHNIEEYVRNNGIENGNVFYCLNMKYVQLVQNNNYNWNSIEKTHNDRRGTDVAKFIKDDFLAKL